MNNNVNPARILFTLKEGWVQIRSCNIHVIDALETAIKTHIVGLKPVTGEYICHLTEICQFHRSVWVWHGANFSLSISISILLSVYLNFYVQFHYFNLTQFRCIILISGMKFFC